MDGLLDTLVTPKESRLVQRLHVRFSRLDSLEQGDLNAGAGSESSLVEKTIANGLILTSFGMDAAHLVNPDLARAGGRGLAGTRLVTNRLTLVFKGRRRPLPCWLAVKAYPPDDEKAGAISVRAFAFGRASRSALQEICHFTLRVEGSHTPLLIGKQLWYGRNSSKQLMSSSFASVSTLA